MRSADQYSLRQVVELTGLSEFTLRGWENRYGAFSPQRTPTGRRHYGSADLQKAMLLRELVKRGHRIHSVAGLSLKKLRSLLEGNEEKEPDAPALGEETTRALKLLALQEWNELEDLFRALSRRRAKETLSAFVLPLLQELGAQVALSRVSIAQEHVISAMTRGLLYELRSQARAGEAKARLVIASPEHDYHDLGILVAHTIAGLEGLRSLFVGPNTPKSELCETALRYGATHVVLGSTVAKAEGAKEELYAYVQYLNKHLPRAVSLWIGGRNSASFGASLGRPLRIFGSLSELEESLAALAGE